jgi:hypothetical protein
MMTITKEELERRQANELAALKHQSDRLYAAMKGRHRAELRTLLLTGALPCRTPWHCPRQPRCKDGCELVPPPTTIQ